MAAAVEHSRHSLIELPAGLVLKYAETDEFNLVSSMEGFSGNHYSIHRSLRIDYEGNIQVRYSEADAKMFLNMIEQGKLEFLEGPLIVVFSRFADRLQEELKLSEGFVFGSKGCPALESLVRRGFG
jgi:hypothetical protein